jgi:hypothetical protein
MRSKHSPLMPCEATINRFSIWQRKTSDFQEAAKGDLEQRQQASIKLFAR